MRELIKAILELAAALRENTEALKAGNEIVKEESGPAVVLMDE